MTSAKLFDQENYAAWKIPLHTNKSFEALSKLEQLKYFCAIAHLAPSSHNSQPWRFFISDSTSVISVYFDRNAVLRESDPAGRQALISIGCAIENLIETAESYDMTVTASMRTIKPEHARPQNQTSAAQRYVHIADLHFSPAQANKKNSQIAKTILSRKMIRSEFDITKKIPPAVMKSMQAAAREPIMRTRFITNPEERLKIAELQGQADGFVINAPKFTQELGNWILPNDTTSFLGMPGATFGLRAPESKRLHEGMSGKDKTALLPEDMLKFSLGTKMLMERSGVIALLFGKNDAPTTWVAAGKLAQRIMLILEKAGISVSIHAGITEVELIHNVLMTTFKERGRLLFVLRAGFAKNKQDLQRPHSPRLPLEQVMLNKAPREY